MVEQRERVCLRSSVLDVLSHDYAEPMQLLLPLSKCF